MNDDATERGKRRTRRATKPLGATQREPLPGTRFPSVVFGENVHAIRQKLKLKQTELAELMNQMGFSGWSYVTVSHVEHGKRTTGVDELLALAVVLNTTVATLLDPFFSGDKGPEVDLGVPWPDDLLSGFARTYILAESNPWERERYPGLAYSVYRKQFADVAAARAERFKREEEESRQGKGSVEDQ